MFSLSVLSFTIPNPTEYIVLRGIGFLALRFQMPRNIVIRQEEATLNKYSVSIKKKNLRTT